MRRIIAVEPGEWIILPCLLETEDFYYRVDIYPDGRIEPSDDDRYAKADYAGPDYQGFAANYNNQHDFMLFLRKPIPLDPQGIMPLAMVKRLSLMAARAVWLEV
jgi:hypothetical protein